MFLLFVGGLFPAMAWSYVIPEKVTVNACTNMDIVVTDRNVRKAIEFFRSCRNLGLTMGDLLPEDYMETLATRLKTTNYQFLQQTNFPQPKLRMYEREFNDLYQEISILSEKVVGAYRAHLVTKKCTCCSIAMTRTTTTTTPKPCPTTVLCATPIRCVASLITEDPGRMDLMDYDYESPINPCSEAAFYIYLLVIAVLSLLVSLWTCRLASKTYKLLKDSQYDEEEAQYSQLRGSSQ